MVDQDDMEYIDNALSINTIEEYLSIIFSIQNKLNKDEEWFARDVLYYRGHSDISYMLLPSVARDFSTNNTKVTLGQYERNLIESAKFKLPKVFTDDLDPIDLLALLQHYGIPTRLLDVTMNPLVALYFAVSNNINRDGEVLIFKDSKYDVANYPIINAIADSYKYAFGSAMPLENFYESVKRQPYFTRERASFSDKDNEKGIDYINKCCQKPLFVQTKEVSERQKRQRGAYIVFPNDIVDFNSKLYFRDEINEINKYGRYVYKRVKINKDIKDTIKKQLDILGINEGYLFGDSIDSVCKQIKDDFPTNW